MKKAIKLFICILFVHSGAMAQMGEYSYQRELKDVSESWYKIPLPDEMFGKISPALNDIRIFGITPDKDTIEAPYLLQILTAKTENREIPFRMINRSENESGYFFTFEVEDTRSVNRIKLDFGQRNFDWRVKLEGSHNQGEWFTIADSYRILSIRNELADYEFTTLDFPDSRYRFYRVFINSKIRPELASAKITDYQSTGGEFRNYNNYTIHVSDNKKQKETEVEIDLGMKVPVCEIKVQVRDSFDYYRPVSLAYLVDSFNTEQGWKYNYRNVASGVLHSLSKNEFRFDNAIAQKFRITIHNDDNQSLSIDNVEVKGNVYRLLARFTKKADYFLVYGKENATPPAYDLSHFINQIPDSLIQLDPGNEVPVTQLTTSDVQPLFQNKIWLWLVMGVIMVTLGWFSVKMMRKG